MNFASKLIIFLSCKHCKTLIYNDVIDTPEWRKIQYLGDIRNMCDHGKDREPNKEEITDLIDGSVKVMKTIF